MDKRKVLRAHYPPRRINTVIVQLDAETYEKLYQMAVEKKNSLADQIRQLIIDQVTN